MTGLRIRFGMSKNVRAIHRQGELIAQPVDESRRRTTIGGSRIEPTGVGNMLDADGVAVRTRCMPSDVIVLDHLHHFAILTHDVVRANFRGGILEPANGAVNLRPAVGDVNDDSIDGPRTRYRTIVSAVGRFEARGLRILRRESQRLRS